MEDFIVKAVERVIRTMQDDLGEPITIDDMARTAMFSKFHFSRMFQRVTGISPGRFLSALRLQEAKRLLLTSSLTVADISHLVGYNSIGTFSSRFRMSVGVSPTTYRQYDGFVAPLEEHPPRHSDLATMHGRVHHAATVQPGHIVLGVFPDRIAQGLPVRHTTLDAAGRFTITGVPNGTWYLIARSVGTGYGGSVATDEVYVATLGPLTVVEGVPPRPVTMWLRPRRIFDPPALLAQLDETMLATSARVPGRAEEVALPGA
jgi:AraC family transcriptional regulator